MLIRRARTEDWSAVSHLLQDSALPLDGAQEHFHAFRVAEDPQGLLGVAGLEVYGAAGLLRSVAVAGHARSRGVAGALVTAVLQDAVDVGVTTVALLTTTASGYFTRLGFEALPRTAAPVELLDSAEFRHACPASATLMLRTLEPSQQPDEGTIS